LTAKLADAETRLLELATVRDTLKASLDIAGQMITQLTDKIAEQEAELATFRATVIETARLDRLQARLAELPAEFRKTHDAREAEAKARVEARWAGLSDTEWQDTRTDLVAYLPTKIGYAARSDLEGQHLGGGDTIGTRLDSLLAATRK
jgi:capsule polysaccharide export protein KpsE/RkpR